MGSMLISGAPSPETFSCQELISAQGPAYSYFGLTVWRLAGDWGLEGRKGGWEASRTQRHIPETWSQLFLQGQYIVMHLGFYDSDDEDIDIL